MTVETTCVEFQGALPDDTPVWVEARSRQDGSGCVTPDSIEIVRARLIETKRIQHGGDQMRLGVDLLPLLSGQARRALAVQARALIVLQAGGR